MVERNTVIVIGSPAPHKNLALLLSIASDLKAVGLNLAVVGALDNRVHGNGKSTADRENVVWLGRLSDDELIEILERCHCLAFPSFTEGFGLPPLEAMAVGCPVVVSDRASMPEICGDAVIYAAPDKPPHWIDAIASLKNEAVRSALIEKGHARAQKFSWKSSAEAYLRAMALIDADSYPRPSSA